MYFLPVNFYILLGKEQTIYDEIKRILKKDGTFLVIEFKKVNGPPGPRKAVRLSREELRELPGISGFKEISYVDLGTYTYLSVFRVM
jgi:ubiquinone/menaquinone biosynthesis C-methylase UbiE